MFANFPIKIKLCLHPTIVRHKHRGSTVHGSCVLALRLSDVTVSNTHLHCSTNETRKTFPLAVLHFHKDHSNKEKLPGIYKRLSTQQMPQKKEILLCSLLMEGLRWHSMCVYLQEQCSVIWLLAEEYVVPFLLLSSLQSSKLGYEIVTGPSSPRTLHGWAGFWIQIFQLQGPKPTHP